jgi:hypothetical protein
MPDLRWLDELEAAEKAAQIDPPNPLRSNENVSAELPGGTDVLYAADGFEEYLALAVLLINAAPRLLAIARAAVEIGPEIEAIMREEHGLDWAEHFWPLFEMTERLRAALKGEA